MSGSEWGRDSSAKFVSGFGFCGKQSCRFCDAFSPFHVHRQASDASFGGGSPLLPSWASCLLTLNSVEFGNIDHVVAAGWGGAGVFELYVVFFIFVILVGTFLRGLWRPGIARPFSSALNICRP